MTVKEFKELLSQFPDHWEVLNGRCSDYDLILPDEVYAVKAVPQGQWVMRSHPTMSAENKAAERDYVYIEGN